MTDVKAPGPAAVRAPSAVCSPAPRQGWFLQHTDPIPGWRPMHGRLRRMIAPVTFGFAAVGVGVLLHAVDPREPGNYPTCPFLWLTGLYCPGCGAMRASASLVDGDVSGAFGFNPLVVIALVGLVVMFALWTRRQWQGRPKLSITRPWVTTALTVITVVFWVARNVPGWTWLSPA